MKRVAAIMIVLVLAAFCFGCGKYNNYAGKYVRNGHDVTYTITLDASGSFLFERKFGDSSSYKGGPFDSDRFNVIKGNFGVDDEIIVITFSFYKAAQNGYANGNANATLKDGKLTILGSMDVPGSEEIAGVYTKI